MRDCAYEEAQIIIDRGIDDPKVVTEQIERYKYDGFPPQYGLHRCGIIIRNCKDDSITKLCDDWYDEIEQGSYRDQISFPYVCWKNEVFPRTIPKGLECGFFKQSIHSAYPTTEWKYYGENVTENPYLFYKEVIDKYPTAHAIILSKDEILYPKWLGNYVSMKLGADRFLYLVQFLEGTVVKAKF